MTIFVGNHNLMKTTILTFVTLLLAGIASSQNQDLNSSDISNSETTILVDTNRVEVMKNSEKCEEGQLDAEMYHKRLGRHFLYGIIGGPIAVIGSFIASPTPESGRETILLSDNQDLFRDPTYRSCYTDEARTQHGIMGLAGWSTWLLILLAVL